MRRYRLIAKRNECRFSQEDMARLIGVDRSTYVRYETGSRTPSLEVAQKIALALGTTVDFLFSDGPKRNNERSHSA